MVRWGRQCRWCQCCEYRGQNWCSQYYRKGSTSKIKVVNVIGVVKVVSVVSRWAMWVV